MLYLLKEINGKAEQYLWDRGNMAAELNADGVVSKRYTRGLQLICDSSDRYYMHNAHGDVVESFSGVARSVHNYTAYGTQGYCENDDMDIFGYCGQQYDWETGNYYMRARYYNPDTGRFISEDPVKDGNNWYSYCAGNPIMFWDPLGLTDVMVSYITRKNGGVIYANCDKSGKTNSIFISMKGVTKTYSVGNGENDIRIVNGRAVIDNEILMNDFSLTELQSLHLQGDKFDSEADAVEAFALMYLPISIDEEQEYAALIKKENGKYIFDDVINSALSAGKNLQELESNERNRVSLRLTNNTTAVIHTHWQGSMYANDFTYIEDYKNMDGKHMYLANSLGEIKYSEQSANGKLIYGFTESRILFSIK